MFFGVFTEKLQLIVEMHKQSVYLGLMYVSILKVNYSMITSEKVMDDGGKRIKLAFANHQSNNTSKDRRVFLITKKCGKAINARGYPVKNE